MALNAFQSNQGTQTNLLTDNTGGTGGTLIPVMKIDVSPYGTAGTAWGGAVTVTSGSINGTVNIGNTPSIGTIGTLGLGSVVVNTLPNLPQGSIQITAGTIASVGTIGTLGLGSVVVNTLPNLPQGSIQVTAGTIVNNGGSAIAYGPAAVAAAAVGNPLNIGGTDSGGTIRTIKVDSGGLQRVGVDSGTISVLPNLPQGSVQVTAGTGIITSGSVSIIAGTVSAGTINAGTFRPDARTTQNIISFGTQFAGTAAAVGTLVGSASVGAGTSLWVNDFSIINSNANVLCVLGFGTAQQGTNVLYRGVLGTASAAGIEKPYAKAVNAGMTNQDLVISLGAAGTVDVSLSYYISV